MSFCCLTSTEARRPIRYGYENAGTFCFTSTEARLLIRDGDRVGRGSGGAREWRLDRGYRPKKTGETVDLPRTMEVLRRCPLAIALRLVLCTVAVSTAVLGRVTGTMSVAQLLRNNPKRKKSNFRSPAPLPAHDLFWANLRVQLHFPPLDLAWNPGNMRM